MTGTPHVRCLLTFDYETFHGRNFGSADEVLFEPANELLQLCASLRVPVTFFPDVCSVWWHREHGEHAFADRFETQMQDAVRQGHDVQLHLHPHWLTCSKDGGRFVFDAAKMFPYELGWGPGEHEAPALIRRSVDYLHSLLQPVNPEYRCVAFRAASLALQPQETQLLRALYDAGIRMDTSITPGVYSPTDTYTLDYRQVSAKANWFMAPERGLEESNSGILEVPIGTFRASAGDRLRFLLRRARSVGARRGEPMSRAGRQSRLGSIWHLALSNLRYLGGNPLFTLSCDTKGFDVSMLLAGLESIIKEHRGEKEIAISLISHPKLMFEEQRALLAGFVEGARRQWGAKVEFTTATRALAALAPSVPEI